MNITPKTTDRIRNIAAYTFVVLFLYTGLSKIVDFNVFYVTLTASPLAKNYAMLIAISVPTIELIIVVLLLIPKTQRLGLVLSMILMVIFTGYVGSILSYSHQPCSCGGIFYKIQWKPHLFINIALTLLAIAAITMKSKDDYRYQ